MVWSYKNFCKELLIKEKEVYLIKAQFNITSIFKRINFVKNLFDYITCKRVR